MSKEARYFVGIDPSATGTGVVVLKATDLEVDVVSESKVTAPKGCKRVTRAGHIVRDVIALLKDLDPATTTVVIEGYAYGNRFSLATLVEVGTLIRYWLLNSNFETYEPAPTAVKAFIGVKKTSKKEMSKKVKALYGYEHKSHDIVDAYVMARMAQVRKNRAAAKNTKQLETVDGMKSQK